MTAKGDAKFTATLDIDQPRYLQVTAYGPMAAQFSVDLGFVEISGFIQTDDFFLADQSNEIGARDVGTA